jgi:hypothetical protein
MPDADLGVVILTDGGAGAGSFVFAVQFTLFELLFDQPPEIDAIVNQALAAQATQRAELQARLRPVDPAAITPYLGRYANPALGEVDLILRDGTLVFDAGEFGSELQPLADETGQIGNYVFVDSPLNSIVIAVIFRQTTDGRPEMVLEVPAEDPAGEAETYVFRALEPPAAATPAPAS